MTKPATSNDLGVMHKLVADVLTKQLQLADDALSGDLTAEQIEALGESFGDTTKICIGAAITFLKNNAITAPVDASGELESLSKALAEKRSASKQRLSKQQLDDAARAFELSQAPDGPFQ